MKISAPFSTNSWEIFQIFDCFSLTLECLHFLFEKNNKIFHVNDSHKLCLFSMNLFSFFFLYLKFRRFYDHFLKPYIFLSRVPMSVPGFFLLLFCLILFSPFRSNANIWTSQQVWPVPVPKEYGRMLLPICIVNKLNVG